MKSLYSFICVFVMLSTVSCNFLDPGSSGPGKPGGGGQSSEYTVTLTASSGGSLQVEGLTDNVSTIESGQSITVQVPSGTQLELLATSASGFLFDQWSGASGSQNPLVVSVDSAFDLTAVFIEENRSLETARSIPADGTLFSSELTADFTVQYFKVDLEVGNTYRFETWYDLVSDVVNTPIYDSGIDTVLTLYNESGIFLAEDDNSGHQLKPFEFDQNSTYSTTLSALDYVCPQSGTYYIRIQTPDQAADDSLIGPYRLLVYKNNPAEPFSGYSSVPGIPGQWRSQPIRSHEEYLAGAPGGESFQIMHAMDRCYSDPDRIFAIQDVSGVWRSDDGGQSWMRPEAQGLYAQYGQSIAVDPHNPDKVLATTYYPWFSELDEMAGIYLSEDGGDTWDRVLDYDDGDSDDHSKIGFDWYRHRFNNQNLVCGFNSSDNGNREASVWYVGFHGGALFRSTDGGYTWQQRADLSSHDRVYVIKPAPDNDDILYMGTSSGLFVSRDGGSSFQPLTNLPDTYESSLIVDADSVVTSVALNPDNPLDIIICVSALVKSAPGNRPYLLGRGLYRSFDGGASFEKYVFTLPSEVWSLKATTAPPAGTTGNTTATNLTLVGSNIDGRRTEFDGAYYIYRHPVQTNWLYYHTNSQGYVSDNDGDSWARLGLAEPAPGFGRDVGSGRKYMGRAITVLNKDNPLDVVYHKSATFWRTDNTTWNPGAGGVGLAVRESASGFTGMGWGFGRNPVTFDSNNPDRLAFFNCDIGMKITDTAGDWFYDGTNVSGESAVWDVAHQGTNAGDFQPIPGSEVIVASVGLYQDNRLMRSTNNGQDWTVTETEIRNYYFIRFHPEDPQLVYASNKYSTDSGLTWQDVPFPEAADSLSIRGKLYGGAWIFGFCEAYPDTVYAVDGGGRFIFRSDDRGQTWRFYWSHCGWDGSRRFRNPEGVTVVAVDPLNRNKVYALDQGTGNILSFDGHTVKELDVLSEIPGNPSFNHVKSIAIDPNNGAIYAGTICPGLPYVFRSEDGGNTWTDITSNMSASGMISSNIAVNPHTGELYKGSMFGTWIYTP